MFLNQDTTEENLKEIDLLKEEQNIEKSSSKNDSDTEEASQNYNKLKDKVFEELRHYFRPEFLNRLDEIIVFKQLNKGEVRLIGDIMIKDLVKRLDSQGYILEVSEDAKDKLLETGYDPIFGARPMRRAITKLIENGISQKLLEQGVEKGDKIVVDVSSTGDYIFTRIKLISKDPNLDENSTDEETSNENEKK